MRPAQPVPKRQYRGGIETPYPQIFPTENRVRGDREVRRPATRTVFACALLALALLVAAPAVADPFPPYWGGGSGAAIHYQPVNWPSNDGDGLQDFGDWQPYRFTGDNLQDNAVQDPSNGGTSPQNYVNVSSGCTDLTLPSTFIYYDDANDVLMFRWRVEQIPYTYAVGPNTQPASAVDPWKSALWTVLIDTDADGYREFAVHLDGQSGQPSTEIDRLFFIYSDTATNSIDYVEDADICLLGHNPTAFVDGPSDNNTGNILNFQSSLSPTSVWPNGANETIFDYGTTRGVQLDQDSDGDGNIECVEYFVDYQIPLAALDASASTCDGPQVTEATPLCLAFATANSLQNPVQKDIVFGGEVCGEGSEPIPTGDCFTLGDGTVNYIDQPIVNEVGASGCGPATLSANVSDAVLSDGCGQPLNSTVATVDFYYWFDENGNGVTDDAGSAWTFAAAGTEVSGTVGEWTASWDSTLLSTGQYLIGVRAEDDQGNVTWSYLTQAEVDSMFSGDFANPSPEPGIVTDTFINSCGTAPSITKSASAAEVSVGDPVDFTLTVTASLAESFSLTQIDDFLPSGWTYDSDQGGTLSPDTSPTNGDTGTISWTFAPAVTIPAGTSETLVFRAIAPTAEGTYTNTADATDGTVTLSADPVEVAVGAPRLTISKTADTLTTSPGDTLTYTITYSNDSPVETNNTQITDELPLGLTFVSATDGGSYDTNTGVITWDVGTLYPGDGPFTVSFTATVDDPYPAGGSIPLVNTATIDSDDTDPASNDASVFIQLPLQLQKSADTDVLAPGGTVTFTIDYANTGNSTATNAVITDPVPAGFTFVSATGGGTHDGGTPGTVTWSLGNLAAGATGSVTFTATANDPYDGDAVATNTATLSSDNFSQVSDSYDVGVSGQCVSTTYYMKDVTGDVGSAGTQNLANTTFPTASSPSESPAGGVLLDNDPGTSAPLSAEMSRFYSDPDVGPGGIIVGDITAEQFITKSNGTKTEFQLDLYDYDPSNGSETLLGSQTIATQGGSGGTFQLSYTFNVGGVAVPEDHRLLWVMTGFVTSTGGTKSVTVSHLFDATNDSDPAVVSVWESQSTACLSSYDSTLNKSVDALSVSPGGTLQYTVEFGNPGAGDLTGATVVDVLPDGVTYVSSTLNGAAASPTQSGQELTFTVNGSGDAAGTITTGNSGTIVINVTVDNPLGASVTSLVNDATLSTNEAPDETAQASTVVQRPNLVIAKAVDKTLLLPGETANYTLTVTNAGNVNATTVSVSDDVPDETYFTFGACTVDVTDAPSTTTTSCTESGGVLSASADVLAIGETIVYNFSMDVGASPPTGLTTLDNFATATAGNDATVAQSETVTVTISTNPNIGIVKTSTPASGPLAAGDTVTYTISVENTGAGDALDVLVVDPIPTNTAYSLGSLLYEAASQTDADDGDTGAFDALAVRTKWEIGTLASGASRSMSFAVVLDSTLPNGTTDILNTATVSSSNGGTESDDADLTAQAAPDFGALDKSAPESMAYPLTTLAATVSSVTVFDVTDATLLGVNDYVSINGTATRITDITGSTITVDTAISGTAGDPLDPVIPFTIRYRNDGTATATNVVISDDLPASTTFVDADNGGTHDGGTPGTVTWTIGTVAPGAGGTVRFWATPTTTGSFDNTAVLSSTELADQSSNTTTTSIGVLEPDKSTSTPSVTNDGSGATATYTFSVTNNSGVTATNVQFEDLMEAGFTYASTTSITFSPNNGVATRTSTVDPTVGDNPATWCCWSLDPGGTITITFDADIDGTVGDGTYQNDIGITSDNVDALDFDPLLTTAEDVTVSFTGPNHVVISDFSATLDDDGRVVVEWTTDAETGTVGFHLLRLEPGIGWVQLTDDLLPGLLTSPQGGSYAWVDETAPLGAPLTYLVVEAESTGRQDAYGPFVADPLSGKSFAVDAPSAARGALDQLRLGDTFAAAARSRTAEGPSAVAKAGNGGGQGQGNGQGNGQGGTNEAPAADAGLRIAVVETGVHRIDAATIDDHLDLAPGEASQLLRTGDVRLMVDDVEVPYLVDGQGRADGLLFYGLASETLYTKERIYRLSLERGETMDNVPGGPSGSVAGAGFRAADRVERDLRPSLFAGPDTGEEFWFWQVMAAGIPPHDRKTFDLETPRALSTGAADAELVLYAQGLSEPGDAGHHVRVSVNGTVVGEGRFDAFDRAALRFVFGGHLLRSASPNTVQVEAVKDAASGMSLFAVDRFDLAWERDYLAAGPSLRFGSEDHELVEVRSLAGDDVLVLDVSDETAPLEVRGVQVEADPLGGFRAVFSPRDEQARYLAVTRDGFLAPASIEVDQPSALRSSSNWADWIAIAPRELVDAADELAEHRESQGLATMVVDLDDVMDEFAGGQLDPWAIRDFLAHAHATWDGPPRFVVLVGEGTYDYKDNLGLGTNLLPPVFLAARWGLYASDNVLADLSGDDGVPEIAIGRLPVESSAELADYVAKVTAYETAGPDEWMDDLLFVADNPDSTGAYDGEIDSLVAGVPAGYDVLAAYLGPESRSQVRSKIFGGLQSGVAMLTFVGHAGLTTVAHEGLLATADVASLQNGARLPVVSAMSCHLGNFTFPAFDSLAEDLLLHAEGGAAAVWAPASLSYNPFRAPLGQALQRAILSEGSPTVGEAVLRALEAERRAGRETLRSQVLLGDPALTLRVGDTR